jgi:hypothetical protein
VIATLLQAGHKKEKTKMYETPKLNRVGDAQEVIMGFISFGNDMDGNFMISAHEWADEDDDNAAAQA